ncbi:MAG: hypothetical protein LQ345_004909 [Seirophora villosa]|nr:MAG: hypothetical protein LQ345_004909 [Seirophora villosa]
MEQVDLKQASRLAARIRTQNAKLSGTGTVRRLQMLRFSCKVVMSPLYGSFNILLPIRFRDRVQWLLKLPGNGTYDQWDEQSARALTSEVMTMKLIYNNSSVPVPRIFGFNVTTANPLKSPYILMERIDGDNLFIGWFYNKSRTGQDRFRESVMANVAKTMVQLNTFTFAAAGALYYDPVMKSFEVGPYRKVNHYTLYGDTNRYSQQGPFTDPKDYFLASLNRKNTEELGPTRQGQIKLLRLLIEWFFQASSTKEDLTGFVLTHPDFAVQNIIVGKDGSILGLVDWDGVVAVPRCIGCNEYPLWLTIDWDPHYWNYDPTLECVTAEPVMVPAELEHYRASYVKAMETALHDESHGTSSTTDSNEPSKGNGKGHSATTTKVSCLARSLYISANEPKALEYNLDMIVEKITNLTAGERFEDSLRNIYTHTGPPRGSQGMGSLDGRRSRHESVPNEVGDSLQGNLPAVEADLGLLTSLSDKCQAAEPTPLDGVSVPDDKNGTRIIVQHETASSAELALAKIPNSDCLLDNSRHTDAAVEEGQQSLLTWVSTICILILSMPIILTMLLMWLHALSKVRVVLLFIFVMFSSSSITVNIIVMLLYGLFFANALCNGNSNLMLKITRCMATCWSTDIRHSSALSLQARGRTSCPEVPMSASANEFYGDILDHVDATGEHKVESLPHFQPPSPPSDTTYAAYQHSGAKEMPPTWEAQAAEADSGFGDDSSEKSDKSDESVKSESTNITVPSLERRPDHAGAGAGHRRQCLGPAGEDLFAMTSEERVERIEQIWEEDPAYDFGGFMDRDLYNGLFHGNLDGARMRRLKIGFQRLLASLDDRFVDFDGLTLSSE